MVTEVERVVDQQPNFEVVEKFGQAAEIASAAAEGPRPASAVTAPS